MPILALPSKIHDVGYRTFVASVAALGDTCMHRRLEDKIRELCTRSITAREDELAIIADLRARSVNTSSASETLSRARTSPNAKNRLRLERRSRQQESREIRLVPAQETSERKRKSG
jgi:hypothetical protein